MKIYSPNKEYYGLSAGVGFVKGVGETDDPYLIEWFIENGYKVGDEEAASHEAPGNENGGQSEQQRPIDEMTVDELKKYAAEKGIDISGLTKKEDIKEKINSAEQEE